MSASTAPSLSSDSTLVVAVCKDIIARRLAVEKMEAFKAMPPDAQFAVFLELVKANT